MTKNSKNSTLEAQSKFFILLNKYLQSICKKRIADEKARIAKLWENQARPEQLEPTQPNWNVWLIMAGRGFGKTRTGSETCWSWINNKRYKRIAIVGQTAVEARQVMIEGESGLLSVIPDGVLEKYDKQNGCLLFKNGAEIRVYGADNYERLRGPQFDAAWVDELAKFKNTERFWEQLMLCLRLGQDPKCIVTTTPRNNPLLTKLIADENCVVTRGSTFENAANLAPGFLKNLKNQFQGTRLEAQEIYAQLLSEANGALWTRDIIQYEPAPNNDWSRLVIAVDPAVTDYDTSDETGIMVIGLHSNKKAYVLEDATYKAKPVEWVKKIVELYHKYQADRVVAEVNKGGDMVQDLLRACDRHIAYKGVRATRGKGTRAEPIVSLYEQGKVCHTKPFLELEDQLCGYVPEISSKSPDRLDALVWGLTDLFLTGEAAHEYKAWV